MKALFAFFLSGVLSAAPHQENPAIQEMRLSLDQAHYQIHSHAVEINLFQERLQKLEQSLASFKQDLKNPATEKSLEKRIISLEKAHETLIADFKTLKTHLNETSTSLAQCQTQLSKIDKQLSSDIQSLKTSLNSMLCLLQNSQQQQKTYTVQPGDSLGQIALNNKTDIKTLKNLNNLTSDTIYSGQKLLLP